MAEGGSGLPWEEFGSSFLQNLAVILASSEGAGADEMLEYVGHLFPAQHAEASEGEGFSSVRGRPPTPGPGVQSQEPSFAGVSPSIGSAASLPAFPFGEPDFQAASRMGHSPLGSFSPLMRGVMQTLELALQELAAGQDRAESLASALRCWVRISALLLDRIRDMNLAASYHPSSPAVSGGGDVEGSEVEFFDSDAEDMDEGVANDPASPAVAEVEASVAFDEEEDDLVSSSGSYQQPAFDY